MKLAFCLALFLGLAVTAQTHAEGYFFYKGPKGELVISNKEPPPGSQIIKQQNMPEATDSQVPQDQQRNNPEPNGQTESSPKPSQTKQSDDTKTLVQPELTFRALSRLLIVFLGLTCVVYSLASMWKENRFGWPLRGIIWFTIVIAGSCAVIALLAGYLQKARALEKVSHRMEAVPFGLE